MRSYPLLPWLSSLFLVSCGAKDPNDYAQISVAIPAIQRSDDVVRIALTNGVPDRLTEFDCLAINVMGEGIPNAIKPAEPTFEFLRNYLGKNSFCSYQGITVGPFPLDGVSRSADIIVPTGSNRVFQVLGIQQTGNARPCQATSLMDTNGYGDAKVYKIDDAVIPIYGDTSIDLRNRYDGLTTDERSNRNVNCAGSASPGILVESGLVIHVRGEDAQFPSGGGAISSWPFRYKPMNDFITGNLSAYNTSPITTFNRVNNIRYPQFDGNKGYEFIFGAFPNLGSLSAYTVITVAESLGTASGTLRPVMSLLGPGGGTYIESSNNRSIEVGFKQDGNCSTPGIRFTSQFTQIYGQRTYEWTPITTESSQYGCVPNPSGWRVHTLVKDIAAGTGDYYMNGAENGHLFSQHAVIAPADYPQFSDSRLRIGVRKGTATTGSENYFTGGFAELLVYNRILTNSERRSVEKFLCTKYALTCAPL